MAMSKKHYVSIADAVNRASRLENADQRTIHMVMMRLVYIFGEDNPRFDSARFIDACLNNPEEQ
jgi:hypothetical protein